MKPLKDILTSTTHTLKLTYTDDADAPIDITGASAKLVLKRSVHAAEVIAVDATIDALNGGIEFKIPATATADVLGEHDSEKFIVGAVLTLASAEKIPLFQTTVNVVASVVA